MTNELADLYDMRGELNARWQAGDRSLELQERMRAVNDRIKELEKQQ